MIVKTRRGLALLLVLAMLVIASAAATTVLRVGIGDQLERGTARDSLLAGDLIQASEAAVLEWLAEHAERVVLPPDVTSPGVLIMDDSLTFGDRDARIVLSAWDQTGMVTPSLVGRKPEFQAAVPDSIQRAIAAVDEEITGLDAISRAGSLHIFPVFGTDVVAVGGVIATHNPIPGPARTRTELPFPAININTAPLPVIEVALSSADISGLAQIEAARADGRRAGLSGLHVGELAGYRLVGSSSIWAVRADATVGRARRSWWTVYANVNGEWRVVQRLVIDE